MPRVRRCAGRDSAAMVGSWPGRHVVRPRCALDTAPVGCRGPPLRPMAEWYQRRRPDRARPAPVGEPRPDRRRRVQLTSVSAHSYAMRASWLDRQRGKVRHHLGVVGLGLPPLGNGGVGSAERSGFGRHLTTRLAGAAQTPLSRTLSAASPGVGGRSSGGAPDGSCALSADRAFATTPPEWAGEASGYEREADTDHSAQRRSPPPLPHLAPRPQPGRPAMPIGAG